MAKNKNFFSKLLTLTAAAAAVGGACYVFRDKIKSSPLYKATLDKAYDLYDKWKERQEEEDDDDFEDFSFDEEDDFDDVFSDEDKSEREYTSITINAKEDTVEDSTETPSEDTVQEDETPQPTEDTPKTEEPQEEEVSSATVQDEESSDTPSDGIIPTIPFGTKDTPEDEPEVLGYENEGLSDVSEDPDVLEEQDKLDF
ncbi:MAG: hypothetical protein PUC55_03460 [Lachnospiraceae bacterium]|nr:hypothetical protein [Lachnospiraceae bacterium]HCJ07689.1 hypothetical protein [Lachnospiraceae bacterium]